MSTNANMSANASTSAIDDIPNVADMVASKFLGADGLDGPQETVTVTRIRRSQEAFEGGKKETVNVFGIRRTDGRTAEVLFCRTNIYACRLLFGDDTKRWIGKRLVLVVDQDFYATDTVPCIRIGGSPDAPAGRAKAYADAFNHPDGRPRKLIKRLKVIVKRVAAQAAQKAAQTSASSTAPAGTPATAPAAAPVQPAPATPAPTNEVIDPETGEVTDTAAVSGDNATEEDDDAPAL